MREVSNKIGAALTNDQFKILNKLNLSEALKAYVDDMRFGANDEETTIAFDIFWTAMLRTWGIYENVDKGYLMGPTQGK